MDTIIEKLIEHFNTLNNRMTLFSELQFQCEGWFKAEILFKLRELKTNNVIISFDREVRSFNNKKIDFTINDNIYIELKHWLIGQQRNYTLNTNFYFTDPTSVGISKDVSKLLSITSNDKWMFIFMTGKCNGNDWANGITRFNSKFSLNIENYNLLEGMDYSFGIIKI